ncbi:MAG: hypothetical protein JNG84_06915 [Archangium sp.]|nr:hypothetical protein [Archangium sp.]
MTAPSTDPRVQWFRERRFSLRDGDRPVLARASGDSGFVAHLSACTRGATGWDWGFRLSKKGDGWCFAHDGRVTVFLDEPGAYVPVEAKVNDQVAVRLPRARENLHPHRFTLHGGQGGCVVGTGFTKLFIPVTFEAAPGLVEAFSSRWADQLRFGLVVANAPSDFQRADSAVVDVSPADEPGVVKLLDVFLRAHPKALVPRGVPYGTEPGPLGLPKGKGQGKADVADGFAWRKSGEGAQQPGATPLDAAG